MILWTIPLLLQTIAWIPTRIIFGIAFAFRAFGRANLKGIDTTHGVIFATNHFSTLDPITVRAALPLTFGPLFYVSLLPKDYQHIPFMKYFSGGFFFKLWGAYPVFRGMDNYIDSLRHHIKILENRHAICIFPSGGISNTTVRPGIGFLAAHTDATIVPTLITKSPSGKMAVSFGKPLKYDDLGLPHDGTKATFQKAAELIMQQVYVLAADNEI